MKWVITFILAFVACIIYAQQVPLPHGMVFGQKPDTTLIVEAGKAIGFMGKKIRVITTIRGEVIKVVKQKGGWFNLDAGQGRIISAHFKNYDVTLPAALKGRIVVIEGVAVKQTDSTNGQRFGGKTTPKKPQALGRNNTSITFEVSGLMVFK